MSKLEVGMYVRSKQGNIGKIFLIDETFYDLEEKNGYGVNYVMYVNDIKKSSYNLIDLIEVGDYVNGLEVYETGIFGHNGKTFCRIYGNVAPFYNEDIKSIVTKESFKSVEYEVANDS